MGSATRAASTAAQKALTSLGAKATLAVGEQLFAVGRALDESAQLRAIMADPAVASAEKNKLISKVFGKKLDATATKLVTELVALRWSSQQDLLAGIEDVAIRSCVTQLPASAHVEAEIFAFDRAVSSDAELELALGSKLGDPASKAKLVTTLLAKKAHPATVAIIAAVVQQPRGRRIGALLAHVAAVVADQSNQSVATVTSATPLAAVAQQSLAKSLAKNFGRELTIDYHVDPSIIGGLRVQVGDQVIDGTIASRLNDVRIQLAG